VRCKRTGSQKRQPYQISYQRGKLRISGRLCKMCHDHSSIVGQGSHLIYWLSPCPSLEELISGGHWVSCPLSPCMSRVMTTVTGWAYWVRAKRKQGANSAFCSHPSAPGVFHLFIPIVLRDVLWSKSPDCVSYWKVHWSCKGELFKSYTIKACMF
jgi:hypothetical protein